MVQSHVCEILAWSNRIGSLGEHRAGSAYVGTRQLPTLRIVMLLLLVASSRVSMHSRVDLLQTVLNSGRH